MVKVFISYSHKDKEYKDELESHLSMMIRNGEIDQWNDKMIEPGEKWDESINESLDKAELLIFLVSSDFLNSEYCYGIETARSIAKHHENKATIIPVIIRHCDWQSSKLAQFQVLPLGGKPVREFEDRDKAFLQVVDGIKVAIRAINNEKKRKAGPVSPAESPKKEPAPVAASYSFEPAAKPQPTEKETIYPTPQKKKSGMGKGILIGVSGVVLLLVVLIFALGGDDDKPQPEPGSGDAPTVVTPADVPMDGQPEFIKQAAAAPATEDNPDARDKALDFYNKKKYDSAGLYYTRYINFLDGESFSSLGDVYLWGGKALKKDTLTAIKFYEMSAAKGSGQGAYSLGWCYANGLGHLKQDFVKAVEYYRIGAAKGEYNALDALSQAYQNGEGVNYNADSAEYWKKQAIRKQKMDAAN